MNPELRFRDQDGQDFPDWVEVKLKDISQFINGKGHEQSISPFGQYIVVNSKFISTEGVVKKFSNEQLEPLYVDDIAMVMSDVPNGRAIAKFFYIDEDNKYTLNQRICALRTTQNQKFIMKQLNRNKYFLAFDDGAKQTNLKKEEVLKCPVGIPDIKEQEKIAKLLSDIDDKIEKQAVLTEKLKNTKDAMLVKMFPQGESKVPEIRFDGFSGDWEEKKLGEILKICHGKDYKHLKSGNIPVYGTGGVMTYVDEYLCDWPCACIGRKGTIDKPQYIDTPFWCVDTLFFSKPKVNQSPLFQYYLFNKIKWCSYNAATGVPSLNGNVIEKIDCKVPSSIEEQEKIGQFFADLDKEIELNQQKYDKLCDVKKALLSKLFPTKEDE